jgi:hypothetical protein
MALLPTNRVHDLATAFLGLGLNVDAVRPVLLEGLPMVFRGGFQGGLPPMAQLMYDIGRVNNFERLADGTVPLQVWLSNAAVLATGTLEERVFRTALDDVSHLASGAPRLQPAALPETKEVIVHRDDLLPYAYFELGIEAARSVAKLRVPAFAGGVPRTLGATPEVHLGTGWLLTPELLMTNHHVVNARKEGEPRAPDADLALQATNTTVQFGFDGDGLEGERLQATSLVAWDDALDYALLRIPNSGRPALRRKGKRIEKLPGDYVAVNIIQHPEGGAKKLGVRNNLVTASDGPDLRYFTDTKAGSSGSPVLTDTWEVAALHRGATFAENVTFQGKNVAYVNVGTHLDSILADVRTRLPALAAEIG